MLWREVLSVKKPILRLHMKRTKLDFPVWIGMARFKAKEVGMDFTPVEQELKGIYVADNPIDEVLKILHKYFDTRVD
jgi:hypothetical protein